MILAPHSQRLPMRAIFFPFTLQFGEPVVIFTRPWMAHSAWSPTRAMGRPLQFQFGEPSWIYPPWSSLSVLRAMGERLM